MATKPDLFGEILTATNLGALLVQMGPQVHQAFRGRMTRQLTQIIALSLSTRNLVAAVTDIRRRVKVVAKRRQDRRDAAEAQRVAAEEAAAPMARPVAHGAASLPAGTDDPDRLFAQPEADHLFRLYARPDEPLEETWGEEDEPLRRQAERWKQEDERLQALRGESEMDLLRGWKVDTFDGVEELGRDFVFTARLISWQALFELERFVGRTLTVGVQQLHRSAWEPPAALSQPDPGEDPVEPARARADLTERYFDGLVASFSFDRSDGGFGYYSATLVPWTHLLTKDLDSRLFLDRTVPEVIEAVLDEYKLHKQHGASIRYEMRLSRAYRRADVITQFNETNHHFVSRLLEREGLTTFFEHAKGSHTWVITDDTTTFCADLPEPLAELHFNGARLESPVHSLSEFAVVRTLQPARVSLGGSYNPGAPTAPVAATVPTLRKHLANPHSEWNIAEPPYEAGDRAEVEAVATRHMKRFESLAEVYTGRSDCPGLQTGRTFALIGYFPPEHPGPQAMPSSRRLLLKKIRHTGRNNVGIDRLTKKGREAEYGNVLECQPADVAYLPELRHEKPRVPGVQRAIVTGPRDKEVHTDAHGCVKVRFLWDRRAPLDDRSSGWVPVVHANDSMSIPHKDDWVLVAFPDLDHPIVIGTLTNAARPLPHPLGEHDRKGIWARSIGPGARQGYSEISVGNQGGKELMRVRAQHDLDRTVRHNEVSTVHNDRQVTVHNNEYLNVLKGHLNMDVFQGSAMLRAKQGLLLESVGESVLVRSGQSISVTALQGITLSCGSSRIVLTPDAIAIESKKVVIKGPDGIELN